MVGSSTSAPVSMAIVNRIVVLSILMFDAAMVKTEDDTMMTR
jgi:hypothetical protein